MANTYTQLYIHFVFAVQNRHSIIHESSRERIEKYICGIATKQKHKPLAVYCMPDHTHILIGLNPVQSLSDLMREIKSSSSAFISDEKLTTGRFNWQEGYGAFSHSRSQLNQVIGYIRNQPEHHHKKSFKEEYLELLSKFAVEYDERYLFEWI